MESTMQDAPLSIARLVKHGTVVHGASTVKTWTGDGFRSATYAEVGARARRLANALRALGIDGDQRVATYMWNDQEHLEAYFAVPAMGAVLHTLNVRLFPEQVTYIANHAEDKVVICDPSLVEPLSKVLGDFETVEHVLVTGKEDSDFSPLEGKGAEVHSYEALLAEASDEFEWVEVDERDAAAMCYTSGTTGNPKGVVYSHRSVVLHSMAACMGDGMNLGPSSNVLVIVPQFHAMAWGLPYAAMLVGASLVMPERFLQPEPLLAMIEEAKPDFAGAVPTIWQGLLPLLEGGDGDVSSLKECVVGGSACPESLMRAFQDDYGVKIIHAWGMTETSPLGSVARTDDWDKRVTQGRFMAGVEARLIADDGSVAAWDDESVGELECRGPWVTASYHLDDDEEKFHDGWLRTGDVGRISPDGFLTLTDRSKDVIKSGGEWISSVELENAIMGHPKVAEAAVVGIPDEKWGERPLATVVTKDDVSASELKDYLADKMAKWQLPGAWAFIDEVPKTSVGKFDKKVIRQRFADEELEVESV